MYKVTRNMVELVVPGQVQFRGSRFEPLKEKKEIALGTSS